LDTLVLFPLVVENIFAEEIRTDQKGLRILRRINSAGRKYEHAGEKAMKEQCWYRNWFEGALAWNPMIRRIHRLIFYILAEYFRDEIDILL